MRRLKYWLLSLYPRRWRERYEEEFIALLEQYAPSWSDLFDIFFYALHEQIFTLFWKGNAMLQQMRSDASIFRVSFVLGSLITLGILITGMLLARAELASYGFALSSSVASCFLLVLYAITGWLAPSFIERTVLRFGAIFGSTAGAAFLLYDVLDNLGNPDSALNTFLSNVTIIAQILLCFVAGLLVTRITRSITTGLLVGMWTGMIAMLIGGISLGVLTALFNDIIIQGTLFSHDYINSGVQSPMAFSILDCFNGFCAGLILLPVVGAILGALGGALGNGLSRLQAQS